MTTEADILARLSPAQRAAAEQMNEAYRRIDEECGLPPTHHYVLDAEHVAVPVGLGTWAAWLQGADAQRIVQQDTVGEFEVSTVFLSLDHSLRLGGPRLLFQTMVCTAQGHAGHGVYQDRYPTWATAERGHAEVVARLRAGTLFQEEGVE